MNPDDYQQAVSKLPPKVRLGIYLVLVFGAALLSAASAYFVAIGQTVPDVIKGLLAAVGIIAIGPLSIAASNVPKKDGPAEEPITEYPEMAGDEDQEPVG